MKSLPLVLILALASVSCDKKSDTLPSASSSNEEAAKRYDRQHDAAMEEATHGTIPEPRPAGPLK